MDIARRVSLVCERPASKAGVLTSPPGNLTGNEQQKTFGLVPGSRLLASDWSVTTGAFFVTDPLGSPTLKREERVALKSQSDHEFPVLHRENHAPSEASPRLL